jgi:Delta24-sterol reductase
MEEHNAAVERLAREIRQFYDRKEPFRIYHGSTNSTRSLSFRSSTSVDTSALNNVISINSATRTALVEPNVSMDALVAATLPHGLLPPVVMEFPGITVGGGFAGTAGESSSFKYGFFDCTVNWAELILATGEIVVVSETQKPDLFRGAAGTFGTLGVATLFEIRLIEAKRFVELTYHPVRGVPDAQDVIATAVDDEKTDFVDGIMFSKHSGVIMTGQLTDHASEPSLSIARFSRATDPWFYLHAERVLSKHHSALYRDLIPLTDYLFRYDRGTFWTGTYAFTYFKMPFNWLTRWLLDGLMHTRTMYHAFHKSKLSQLSIIQDMALPNKHVAEFADWIDEELNIYPLWLCPLRQNNSMSMHPHSASVAGRADTERDMLLNIGVWGLRTPGSEYVTINRKIEAKLKSLHGMKWLYAQTFYTEDEFWEIYDKRWYEDLREKYNALALPSVYDKVKTDVADVRALKGIWSIWPLAGVYGVLSALKGGEYLISRKS